MDHAEFLTEIRQRAPFPRHGWAKGQDACLYLVFPILRATAIWKQTGRALSVRELDRMSYFHGAFKRILYVLEEITHAEDLIRSGGDRPGTKPEEYGPVDHANVMLPIWVEYFYIYFKHVAYRLTAALRPLVSNSPGTFPHEYKNLLKEARKGAFPTQWNIKVHQETLLNAIRNHSDWYCFVADDPTDPGKKGIRELLIHKLVESVPQYEIGSDQRVKRIQIHLREPRGTTEVRHDVDIFSAVPDVISSFCDFLSALPPDLWQEETYQVGDITYRATGGDWPTITRFFPSVT